MADAADEASCLEELERENAIAAARLQLADRQIRPKGECHACGTACEQPKLFCDKDCALDWEWVQKGARRKGGLV